MKTSYIFEGISCGNPGQIQIPDGTVTGNGFNFGGEIHYSCDDGFTLIGSSVREYQVDGSWSCNTPRCTSSGKLTFSNELLFLFPKKGLFSHVFIDIPVYVSSKI